MKIAIDASRYNNSDATGVEWYGKHIIEHLLPLIKSTDELTLYSRFPLEGLNFTPAKNRVIFSKKFWTLRALSKEIRDNPPEVLFIPSHVLPLTLAKRSIITVHDLAFKRFKRVYSFVQYNYLNWSTKMAVKKAAKIIVPSEVTKTDLVELYSCDPLKIEVIHHGFTAPKAVDENQVMETSEVFKYFEIKKDSKYVFFVGRLESKKNLVNLVSSFAEFSKTHPDYRLVLAGSRGVGFHKIIREIKKLKIIDKVIMPGYITEEEKYLLYKYCSLFAFPSLYEGFGLPLLEAFFHKKAVLCSNCSSLPEVAGGAAHLIDPVDVNDIADGMKKLADNKEYRETLIAKGSERLRNFSWNRAAEKTVNAIYGQ
jgi:glycosyltransferase involved in cell wall biosynthesis